MNYEAIICFSINNIRRTYDGIMSKIYFDRNFEKTDY